MKVNRNEWIALFGYGATLTLGLLLATWAAGCGDAPEPGTAIVEPRVEISCDYPVGFPRCFVTAHDADEVVAHYGVSSSPAWWDEGITEDRVVYMDAPPPGVLLTVEACNAFACVTAEVKTRRAA